MILHSDNKLFSEVLSASSKYYGIKSEFIEKDYWITLLLKNLVGSKYSELAVFKGGTSLAKAYRLIIDFRKIWILLLLQVAAIIHMKSKN